MCVFFSPTGRTCTCPDTQCIMAGVSSSTPPTRFSSCSVSDLGQLIGTSCLLNTPTTTVEGERCGNGLLEGNEACDCGTATECTGTCCNPATCQLTTGSQCSAGQCCNTATCRFSSSATTCRAKSGECDIAESCTGASSECPSNTYVVDGTSCSSNTGYCVGGRCPTHTAQCTAAWSKNY